MLNFFVSRASVAGVFVFAFGSTQVEGVCLRY